MNSERTGRYWRSSLLGVNAAIIVFNALLIGVLWYAVLGRARVEREDTIRAAIARNDSLAIAFEQYTIRTLESADAVIKYLIREYMRKGAHIDLEKFMADYTVDNNAIVGVVLADEHGDALTTAYSRNLARRLNLADREHFRVHVERDSGRLFVGKPVQGRLTGQWLVPLTRRINKPDGTFGGVAMALIEPNRFTDVLREAKLNPIDVVSLVGLDGITRARLKGAKASWGEDISKSPLFQYQASRPNGNYSAAGQLDGVPRFFSYRTLPDYQVISIVGAAQAEVLAEFERRQARYFWAAAAVSAIIAAFAALLMLAIARRKRMEEIAHAGEQTLRELVDALPIAVYVCDADGLIESYNRRAVELWGREPRRGAKDERFCGSYRMYKPDGTELPHAECPMAQVLRTGTPVFNREIVIERPDGLRRAALVNAIPRHGAQGRLNGAINCIVDITEHQRAQAALQESDARFRTIFEHAGIGIAIVDIESGRIMRCNQALAKMLGYGVEELQQLTVEDVSEPEDYQKDRELWRAMVEGTDDRFRLEKRYRRRDGSPMWGVLTSTTVRAADRKPLFIIGMLEDITDRKRSQEEIFRLAKRLTTTMESITDAFFSLDREWRFSYVNQAFETMLQRPRAALLGKMIWEEYPDAVGSSFDRQYRRALDTMRMVEFEEFYAPLDRWLEVHAYPSEQGLAVYLRDVTARKQAEIVNARMIAVVQSSDDAIISKNLDGIILSWNAAAERIFGYAAEEIVGHSIMELIPPECRHEEEQILGRIRRGERVDHFETVRLAKDGRRIDLSISVSPIKDNSGKVSGATKVARDIGERKRADEALRSYAARLKALSRRLMELEEQERRRLGRELHDRVGSNLSALLLSLQVLDSRFPPHLVEEAAPRIRDCESLLRETIVHVRDVLAELRPPVLDDLGLLAALDYHVRLLAKRGGTEIATEGREPVPRLPAELEIALFRIAQEALNNATRHAQAARISVGLHPDAAEVTLIIADDGKGFDATRRQPGSTSLGLATMRERAEAINARFSIETAPGKGTRVRVSVPYGA